MLQNYAAIILIPRKTILQDLQKKNTTIEQTRRGPQPVLCKDAYKPQNLQISL